MINQGALTIITKIHPEKTDNLKKLLEIISKNVGNNEIFPFGKLTNIHFARFVVLDESLDLDKNVIQPNLVFLSSFDGSLDQHLKEIVDVVGAGLDQIYCHCQGYPDPDTVTRQSRLAYLRSHLVDSDAFYVNTIGRTAQQIRQEAKLREVIEGFLDQEKTEQNGSSQEPMQIRAAVQKFVNSRPDLNWAKTAPPSPRAWRLKQIGVLASFGLGVLVLLPLLLPALLVWAILIRMQEERDVPEDIRPDNERVRQLRADEDQMVINQFSAVGYIKPGWIRRITVKLMLWLVNFAARYVYNNGSLTSVKTIHFARWVMIDEGRRLLFASNYDGSLESYMDDFIDRVAWGLNAVFSNGVGYPKTRWLLFGGARNEPVFKHFLRNHQLQTQVWYAPYNGLTAINIDNNTQIRKGLDGSLSREETEAWLRRF